MKARAFTLIELLVVISIIALLSSIVVGSVNAAREKGRIAAARQFEANMHHAFGGRALGAWDLNEGSDSAVSDRSGNDFHGTVSGTPAWVPGVEGTALRFDGTNYVLLPDLRSRTDLVGGTGGKILFMAWIKPTQYTASVYSGFAHGFPGFLYLSINPSRQLQLMVNCAMGTQGCLPANNNYWPVSSKTIPLDKWTHVAFLMEGGVGYKFYIDGKLDTDVTGVNLSVVNMGGGQTAFGRSWNSDPAEAFRGEIDSVKFYYAEL